MGMVRMCVTGYMLRIMRRPLIWFRKRDVYSDPRKKLVSKDLITYVEDRKGHDRRYAIAPDKIKAEIGWEPETMFKDGIRLTIKWFFEHEDWMKNVTSGDYQKYYEDMYAGK